MKPGVARALISSYERQMQTRVKDPVADENTMLRWLIHRQAGRFGKWLGDRECKYQPFKW